MHADDPAYRNIKDISELPAHRLNEIRRFFEDYKKNENKEVIVDEILGAEDARKAIVDAQALYRAEYLPKQQR